MDSRVDVPAVRAVVDAAVTEAQRQAHALAAASTRTSGMPEAVVGEERLISLWL